MSVKDEPRGVSICARLPQGGEPGSVTVQLTGQDLRLIATGHKSRLDALQSVVGDLQAGFDLLRRQEGAEGPEGGQKAGDTRILLGRSAIPDPQKLGGREPVTRYAVPLGEDQVAATAALEFYDDNRRSVVVGFVLPASGEVTDTRVSLRWGLRDEILRELYEHLKRRFEA